MMEVFTIIAAIKKRVSFHHKKPYDIDYSVIDTFIFFL